MLKFGLISTLVRTLSVYYVSNPFSESIHRLILVFLMFWILQFSFFLIQGSLLIIFLLQVCHKEKQATLCTSCNKEQLGQKVDRQTQQKIQKITQA